MYGYALVISSLQISVKLPISILIVSYQQNNRYIKPVAI